ncbi:MAG TPA: isoaspartyl peptidase/L-asparaginase [Chitinophagaceae bacterium]|nr:isoaspartyl peptidase/L-asparaginase [Chitinophagaceae bacterium]
MAIAMAVHGGAGPDEEHIHENLEEYKKGLAEAVQAGYKVLERGGSAVDAVEAAVKSMEDNPIFNAGRGSALNSKGEVEMCASIMKGKNLKAGAVAIVKSVKNPVSLARYIMENTSYVCMSGEGALEVAKDGNIELEPDAYFITDHQVDTFLKARNKKSVQEMMKERVHATVGAVALDSRGNLAAATSSGGTSNTLPNRIGDSSQIGCGCYANNKTCAVSGTGDGEFLIKGVIAHHIASAMEFTGTGIQEACELVIHEKNKDIEGDIGVISIDPQGNFGIAFNSERMHRAWMSSEQPMQVKIYKE